MRLAVNSWRLAVGVTLTFLQQAQLQRWAATKNICLFIINIFLVNTRTDRHEIKSDVQIDKSDK